MKYKYIVLRPDEDGSPARFITEEELQSYYLSEARGYHFLGEQDLDKDKSGTGPQYWTMGNGDEKTDVMIVEIAAIRVPRPVTTEYQL